MKEVFSIGSTLRFVHGFFADQQLRGIQITPCASSLLYMDAYGILLRLPASELLLLYRQGGTALSGKLYFWLSFTDPYFFHYTDGPMGKPADGAYLFSTSALAADGTTLQNSWTTVPVRTAVFDYPVSSAATISITAKATGKSWFTASVPAANPGFVTINISSAPEGMYVLSDGKTSSDFFLARSAPAANVSGLIEIALPGNASQPYTLEFAPRAAYWKYRIISSKSTGKQYSVTSGNGITFSESTSGDGPEIVSDQPVVFREVPQLRLQLVELNGDNGNQKKVIIPDLSFPSPKTLRKDASGTNQLYSETNVYL